MDSQYWDWRTQGLCSRLDAKEYDKLFFPTAGRSIKDAKAFCNNCPVIAQCLSLALDTMMEGIWAGTTYSERITMQKVRRQISGIAPPAKKPKIVSRSQIVFS